MKKRFFAALVSLCLIVSMLPVTAAAAGSSKTIMLYTGPWGEAAGKPNAATVYFGKDDQDQPAAWRVIQYTGRENEAWGNVLLLAAKNMGTSKFSESNRDKCYETSLLRQKMDALADKLTSFEQSDIIQNGYLSKEGYYDSFYVNYWPLSLNQANTVTTNLLQTSLDPADQFIYRYWWWLGPERTTPASEISGAHVRSDGNVFTDSFPTTQELGVRPAVRLSLPYILFISAAAGGKADDVGTLSPIPSYTENKWKATIKDESRAFTVTGSSAVNSNSITIQYTGATVGENEYISVILADENDDLLYYGKVQKPTTAEGEVTVPIPDGLAKGTYTLKVFSEQCNGDYNTDCASNFQEIDFTVGGDTIFLGRSIVLNTDVLQESMNTAEAATVYFGKDDQDQPAAWRVIGYNGSGAVGKAGKATLLASEPMGTSEFGSSTNYSGSSLQSAMTGLEGKLHALETAAVIQRELDEIDGPAVSDAGFWPLSHGEANSVDENIRQASGEWWLRTPNYGDDEYIDRAVDYVRPDGSINAYGSNIGTSKGVRPAFHMNLDSVLFMSAAEDGKNSADGTFSPVFDYSGTEWKLTLLDETRSNFTADLLTPSVSAGEEITVTCSNATVGGNEYVSAILADGDGLARYYGHIGNVSFSGDTATGTISIPDDLSVGAYTLHVFNEQCNDDYQTDYASAFQTFTLYVTDSQQGSGPSASFTATDDCSGILSNVDTSMEYSIDGGTTWNSVTGDQMFITGVTAEKDVQVRNPSDLDPEVQTIDITQATQPTVSSTDCTTSDQNDGTISSVDSTMEYKLSTGADWITITGDEVTGLTNGTYAVRVMANGTVLASPAATVIIAAHTCEATGEWKYDETNHWKLCSCGAKTDIAEHSYDGAQDTDCNVCGYVRDLSHVHQGQLVPGTPPTCTQEGTKDYYECSVCHQYFEDADCNIPISDLDSWKVIPVKDHTWSGDYLEENADANKHYHVCTVCGEKDAGEAHVYDGDQDTNCNVCGYERQVTPPVGTEYTVNFDANGGSVSPSSAVTTDGKLASLPTPILSDYEFMGWYTEAVGGQLVSVNTVFTSDTTIYARWKQVQFSVSGTVYDHEGTAVSGATVVLMQGSETIDSGITGDDGAFTFTQRIPAGAYNIVTTYTPAGGETQTKTSLVTIMDQDATVKVTLPSPGANSTLEVTEDTPAVVVGGLDEEAEELKTDDVTKVTISMSVEEKSAAQAEGSGQIQQAAAAGTTLQYLEIAITKTVVISEETENTAVSETKTVLEIVVPFDFSDKKDVTVYRYHNGMAEALTNTSSKTDGTYQLDEANGLIHIFASKFSTYAVGYTTDDPVTPPDPPVNPVDPSTPSTGGSEPDGDYTVTVDRPTGGKVTVNPGRADKGDTVAITAVPNDGYVVDEINVNGVTNGVKYLGGNKYSFEMPGSAAKVSVTFVKDGTQTGFPFTDVSDSFWARSEIEWAYENGYVNGSTATTYNPNGTISRQQVWMILARIAGENPDNMTEAKDWAVANGISDGTNPGEAVTRQQLAALLYRYAVQRGMATVTLEENLSGYPDAASVSGYAIQAMNWAVGEGILTGTTAGTLNPGGTATRAQLAVMLYRWLT